MSEERSGMAHDGEEDFGLDELGAAIADLRAVLVQPAAPDVAAEHLARMESAALEAAASSAAPVLSRRRTGAADTFWTMPRRIVAFVAAAFVALFGLGGLGMAGALPGPLQDVMATITEPLGVELPRSDDAPGRPDGSDPSPTTDPAASGAPGQTGSTPGQSGETPGQSGETPAAGSEAPGQSGSTPGQSGETPGQTDNPSVTAPGQVGDPSASAPGQTDNPSVTAPGQVDNPSATAPGQSGAAPGNSGNAGSNGNGNGSSNSNPSATAPGRS